MRAYANEWEIIKDFVELVKYGKKTVFALALKELGRADPVDEYKPEPHKCPVCGEYDFHSCGSMAVRPCVAGRMTPSQRTIPIPWGRA